jgi:hypothetical protein
MRGLMSPVVLLVAACGSGTPEARPAGDRNQTPADEGEGTALANASVYDEKGRELSCEPPRERCPEPRRDREFLDRCVLGGYQIRKCGCNLVCSGNVMVQRPHYDAQGTARTCEARQPGCTPPETTASFQDACNDAGHKLVLCGCEWLCAGPLREDHADH